MTEREILGLDGASDPCTDTGAPVVTKPGESTGAATLVTSGSEVLEEVGAPGDHLAAEPRGPERRRDRLDHRQLRVLDAVPVVTAAPPESVARTAGLGVGEVRGTLAILRDLGLVREEPGGWRLAAPAAGSV